MTTTNVTIEDLRAENIVFNNEHEPWEEAFEIELTFNEAGRGHNFGLWVNHMYIASYTTLSGLNRRADALIRANHLQRVEAN